MSNAERWDHSGYKELQNEEKSLPVGSKRPGVNKKVFYKYKEGMVNDKTGGGPDFNDNSGPRKNPNKKFSNFNQMKYNPEEWNNQDMDKLSADNDVNSLKNKQKKRKKDEFYQNYDQSNENYFPKKEEGVSPQMSSNSAYSSYNGNPMMNVGMNNSGNNGMPFNNRKKNLNAGNNSLNFNPEFYTNKNMMGNGFQNFNSMYNATPFGNMPMNGNYMNNNNNSNSNKNLIHVPYSGQFYPQDAYIKPEMQNSKIIVNEELAPTESDQLIVQQSELLSNDALRKNSKISTKNVKPQSHNNSLDMIASQVEEGGNSGLMNTPRRNSVTSTTGVSANTGNSNYMNNLNHTPTVGFSPKNEQIYMCNILKMPNNFNSPMRPMNENFIFHNYPHTTRGGKHMNVNGSFFGMIPGMSPMNSNMPDGPNNMLPMQGNNNMPPNNFSSQMPQMSPMPPMNGFNPNYNSYPYNAGNNSHMKVPFNGVYMPGNEHQEDNANDGRQNQKKFAANSNMQLQRNNNGLNNMNKMSPFDKGSPNNNSINPNFFNNKKNQNSSHNLNPNMNPNMNPNANLNPNLNYNNMKPYAGNNRKYNNNNNGNNMNMQNMNNQIYKMKCVKSDKYLGGNNIQNGMKGNERQMPMMNMMNPGKTNLGMSNMNAMGPDFNNMCLPNQNKVWKNSNTSLNGPQGNQSKINELTNIINNTIRDTTKVAGSFESIKEELHKANSFKSAHPHEEVDAYFSSDNNSDYEIAEEVINLEKASRQEECVLCVNVKLDDREETIPIVKGRNIYNTAKLFVLQHKLNQNLIKPICERIKQALGSIDLILDSPLNDEEHKSLSAIQSYYTENKNLDDSDFINILDLSCITDIGSPGNYISDSLSLSTEDVKKIERLNISR